jgi:hypothetical protein
MKTQGTIAVFCALLILCSTFSSCKKDNDKKAACKIVTVTQTSSGSTGIINITYNNDGKISTVNTSSSSGTSSKVFTYSGNTINIVSTNGPSTSRDSVTLNANGRASNIRSFNDMTGTTWSNQSFEYNGNELLKVHQTDNTSSTPETTVATYTNGNLVTLTSPSSTTTIEYFTDKNTQPGDYLELAYLINYGVGLFPHKNLLKTIDGGGGSVTNFNYEFDADGKITKVTATGGGSITTLTYQYTCN